MTREAASRPDPRRTLGARFRQFREARDRGLARRSGSGARGAGSPTCVREVRRPGRPGSAATPRATPRAGTSPAPSSSSCSAGSTLAGRPDPALADPGARGQRRRPRPARPGAGRGGTGVRVRPGAGRPRRPVGGRAGAGRRQRAGRPGGRRRPVRAERGPRPSWWRRGYRLVGDPELADDLREPAGRPRAATRRAASRASWWSAPTWPPWPPTRGPTARSPRASPPGGSGCGCCTSAASCRARADLLGRGPRLGAPGRQGARARRARPVGACPGWSASAAASPPRRTCPGEAGELARRVGSVLALLVLPDEGERLLAHRLRPRVEAARAPGAGGRLPRRTSRRTATGSRPPRSGCAAASSALVTLCTATWTTSSRAGPRSKAAAPSPDATLDLAVRVLLDDQADDHHDDRSRR